MNAVLKISLCLTFVVLWSSGWVGSKYAIGLTGPFTFLTWRYLIVVILLFSAVVVFRLWRKLSLREFVRHFNVGFLSHGVFLGASLGAMQLGVSAGMVAFVTAMQPLLTACASRRFTNESPTSRHWFGMTLGFCAVAVVISSQITLGGNTIAYVLLVASLFALSIATLVERAAIVKSNKLQTPEIPLLQAMFIHSIAALILFALLGYNIEGLVVVWSEQLIFALSYMTVIVSIGSYGLMFLILRYMSAIKFSALAYLTPPATMLMAWSLFDETLSAAQWAGLGLAALAVFIVYRADIRQAEPSTKIDASSRLASAHPEMGRFRGDSGA